MRPSVSEALEFIKRKIEGETSNLTDEEYLDAMDNLADYCEAAAMAKRAEL